MKKRVILLWMFARTIAALAGVSVVVAPEPLAARAGMQVLAAGGTAADAAVAVGFVLAVTYPQAGNIGGGGFAMVARPGSDPVALDFRETAPAAARKDMFLDDTGRPVPGASTDTAAAAGVPGTVRGLYALWRSDGRLAWSRLLAPAIRLAKQGHVISPYQHERIDHYRKRLSRDPDAARMFLPEGRALPAGARWRQPALARTLAVIGKEGPDGFYAGRLSRRFVAELRRKGGIMTMADLAVYRAVWRTPTHVRFRGDDLFCMPLPSSGGVTIGQILGMLSRFKLDRLAPGTPDTIALLAEIEKRAYADRNTYLGDPDRFPIHWRRLLDPQYLAKRAAGVDPRHATPSERIGPGLGPVTESGLMIPVESPDTTSFAVMDRWGRVVSVTYTLNAAFGSGILLADTGVLLNNEMDDFAIAPGTPNLYGLVGGRANAVGPNKRMLSSMTPTIVLRDGRFRMALGSPGGSTIITTVLQTYLNAALFGMNAEKAVAAPRFHHQWLPDEIRMEPELADDPALVAQLEKRGYRIRRVKRIGDAVMILRTVDGTITAAADPRGSGVALVR